MSSYKSNCVDCKQECKERWNEYQKRLLYKKNCILTYKIYTLYIQMGDKLREKLE